ncbi:serine/threonine-protein kinase SMG1-like, partial [Actinia tenebrosa]|uniref:Serine/threonine-protein kinase SMG1-like n=1 Tax=Actinia tenebrosa TaxID=6105 RepID=A0A6P8HC92_ACTTE
MENTAKVAGDRLSDLTSREGDWFLEELCSMSGNVTQLLSLLRGHPLVIEEQKSSSKEELNNSIKGIFAVHKVFSALQELMTNFRNIIVPEAIKSFTSGDPSVTRMLESLERLVHGEDIAALAKTLEREMNSSHECQDVNSSSISSKISILQQQFDAIQQSRNAIGKKSSEQMSAGQMLLAGFNGLFTKVESELDLMNAILAQVNSSFGNKTCDVVQEAKKLQ